ncbi:MAG TPA: adenylate/guanylate cyclase domain-containing protein, partial [Chloroflexota bacterium]
MVLTIFFDDIKGSTALKESMVGSQSEQAFHTLRHEHDQLMQEIITRDGAGQIVKSTGDGVLAVFLSPSVAVQAAMEIQERLHGHQLLSVRIGIDTGEVQVDWEGDKVKDVFGRHVDWAARVEAMGDGGHIVVTKPVYTDAFSWITKNRVAWKEQGQYHVKPGEPPLEVFEPYNANLTKPMDELHGQRTIGSAAATAAAPAGAPAARPIRVVGSAELVAQEVKAFAEQGAGIMYWFKAPLGDICYPEGFRCFVLPALANPRITKLRFIVDRSNLAAPRIWQQAV